MKSPLPQLSSRLRAAFLMVLHMGKLEVKLADGSNVYIEVGDDVDGAMTRFLGRKAEFGGEWIPVHAVAGSQAQYVRYEQIVQVRGKVA